MASAGISGMGIVSAIGNNVAETAARLYDADPVLPQQPARITTGLRRPVFEVSTDAEHRIPLTFLMQALTEALADARLTPEILKTKRVGVAVGTTVACQLDNLPCYARLRTAEDNDPADTEQCIRNYMEGIPAEYIRDLYGLNGPAITVSNACASGADAAMIALNWLRTGECDLVIAGGCDSVSKVAFSGFNALRVSSPEPCTPFDADRTGLNLGDGAGVVILEDPASAAERGVSVTHFLAGAGKQPMRSISPSPKAQAPNWKTPSASHCARLKLKPWTLSTHTVPELRQMTAWKAMYCTACSEKMCISIPQKP